MMLLEWRRRVDELVLDLLQICTSATAKASGGSNAAVW